MASWETPIFRCLRLLEMLTNLCYLNFDEVGRKSLVRELCLILRVSNAKTGASINMLLQSCPKKCFINMLVDSGSFHQLAH